MNFNADDVVIIDCVRSVVPKTVALLTYAQRIFQQSW